MVEPLVGVLCCKMAAHGQVRSRCRVWRRQEVVIFPRCATAPSAGVPLVRFHDLRHAHATLPLKQGQPVKVVSERLGHASPAFTLAVYQHVIPGMKAEAARACAALIDADE